MFQPEFPITTRRLVLRPYVESDVDAVLAIQSRPDVVEYLYDEVRGRDEVEQWLAAKIAMTTLENDGDSVSVAVDRDGELIGGVMLRVVSAEHRCGEIGYTFHPDHHGHGYAGEAALEMLRLGFEGAGYHRVIGRLDAANTASARVLEKLGMRREAHLVENEFVKGRWADEAVYAMLAREWRAR